MRAGSLLNCNMATIVPAAVANDTGTTPTARPAPSVYVRLVKRTWPCLSRVWW